ncbi:antitoxin [Streptomyces sp. CA-249302]|uniref:antitoxin n=1 Tax=Streptomyces sp. CA-249302 TaxID=3240058 RepID=UPI003D8B8CF8
MGLLDNLKAKLSPAKDKVSGLAQQHGDKISHGLDKAAKVVDEKTKGKYSDKIQTGTGKAKGAMDRLAHKGETETGGGTVPPDTPTRPAS